MQTEIQPKQIIKSIVIAILIIIIIVAGLFAINAGWRFYKVWGYAQDGKAELARAEWTKKIIVEQGKAELENQKLKAEAEVERAKGVAEANKIIGDSLKGNEDYLRYLWISNIQSGTGERIYIPTEANIPILEAGRR